jgi:hypothetical protein
MHVSPFVVASSIQLRSLRGPSAHGAMVMEAFRVRIIRETSPTSKEDWKSRLASRPAAGALSHAHRFNDRRECSSPPAKQNKSPLFLLLLLLLRSHSYDIILMTKELHVD